MLLRGEAFYIPERYYTILAWAPFTYTEEFRPVLYTCYTTNEILDMWKLKNNDLLACAAALFIAGYMVMFYNHFKPVSEKPPAPLDTMEIAGRVFHYPHDSLFKWTGPADTITKWKAKFRWHNTK